MGKFVKITILLILLVLGGFGYYMTQMGLDPLNIDDIKAATSSTKSKIDKISETVTDTIADKDLPAKESKVYKRKDADGNWYYSNEPPEKGKDAEVTTYRSDTNLLPPLPEDKNKEK